MSPVSRNQMKLFVFAWLLLATLSGYAQTKPVPKEVLDTSTYSGTYNGKNLFFQNDYSESFGSCVQLLKVNGKTTTDAINVKAFEVDFKSFNFKKGDKIVVKVVHKKGCTFKCLNEQVLNDGHTYR